MKPQRTSYAFLMEMLWVCAFFLIGACIFVLSFAKAERLSQDAETLNQAVQAVSNAMEDTMAGDYGPKDTMSSDPGLEVAAAYKTGDFTITIETSLENSILTAAIEAVSTRDGSLIYRLEGSRFLPEAGGNKAGEEATVQ